MRIRVEIHGRRLHIFEPTLACPARGRIVVVRHVVVVNAGICLVGGDKHGRGGRQKQMRGLSPILSMSISLRVG